MLKGLQETLNFPRMMQWSSHNNVVAFPGHWLCLPHTARTYTSYGKIFFYRKKLFFKLLITILVNLNLHEYIVTMIASCTCVKIPLKRFKLTRKGLSSLNEFFSMHKISFRFEENNLTYSIAHIWKHMISAFPSYSA